MASLHSRNIPATSHEGRWPTAIAALAVGTAFFSLWFWLLPQWLGFRVEMAGVAHWRWLAALPSVLGFAVALRCVWDFGWTGHGTPAPIAPPRRLVVVGFYRHVRNPMYVGFAVGWIGLWVVFGHANIPAVVAVAVVALGVHLFVILYEEPTLRGKFGADYETYCQNVRRWWPRLKGWDKREPKPEPHSARLLCKPHRPKPDKHAREACTSLCTISVENWTRTVRVEACEKLKRLRHWLCSSHLLLRGSL